MATFNKNWNIVILDSSLSSSTVNGWLRAAGIPSCHQFSFNASLTNSWRSVNTWGSIVPSPYDPWTILIVSKDDPRFSWNIMGISFTGNHNCAVAYGWDTDTPIEIGARIWHEMIHSMGISADDMKTSERGGFTQYLNDTSSPYKDFALSPDKYDQFVAGHTEILITYYRYLYEKYFKCSCYNVGCATTNTNPYVVIDDTNDDEDEITHDTKKDNTMIYLLVGAAILLGMMY